MPWIYIWTSPLKAAYVGTTPVKEIYVGTTKVRPVWYTPNSNTLLYLPLNGTTTYTDKSPSARSMTNSWVTFWTHQWVDCAYFQNWNSIVSPNYSNWTNNTVICWAYLIVPSSNKRNYYIFKRGSTDRRSIYIQTNWAYLYGQYKTSSWYSQSSMSYSSNVGKWVMIANVGNWSTHTQYVYSSSTPTKVSASWASDVAVNTTMSVWYWGTSWNWYLSEFIEENRGWSETELTDYFNLTKSKYGY